PFVTKFHDVPRITSNALAVTHGVNAVQAAALVAGGIVLGVAVRYDGVVPGACVALALLLVFAVDQWEVWYPVLFVPLLVVARTQAGGPRPRDRRRGLLRRSTARAHLRALSRRRRRIRAGLDRAPRRLARRRWRGRRSGPLRPRRTRLRRHAPATPRTLLPGL